MTVKEAVEARRSTRYYQQDKKISDADMKIIVEAGRKAPNGLALEAWKFVVLSGDLKKLEVAVDQNHVTSASHVVALVNYKHEYVQANPEVITDLLVAKGFPEDKLDKYMGAIDARGTKYYREQIMFAASQMVLQAAGLGIGSVIVGGFNPEAMAKVIDLDTEKYEVALLVDFGYAVEMEVEPRILRDEKEVVSYIEL